MRLLPVLAALAAVLVAPPAAAQAPDAALAVELNKLDQLPNNAGCRAWLVAANPHGEPLDQLQLDLVLFGTGGVIARRVAVEAGPLGRGRTTVRPFDLPGTACDALGRVLLNDVLACRAPAGAAAAGERAACLERVSPASRVAAVPFTR